MLRHRVGILLLAAILIFCVSCNSKTSSDPAVSSNSAAVSTGPKKSQNQQFANYVLPTQFFSDPSALATPLTSQDKTDGDEILRQLWDAAGTYSGNKDGKAPEGLDFKVEVFGDPKSTAALITMPVPSKPQESHFAAIIFDAPGVAEGTPEQTRYFTLEDGDSDRGKLVEWSSDADNFLQSKDHGDDVVEEMSAFSAKVQEIIGAVAAQ